MSTYPLYDVPWLVREPNDSYMSLMRHATEVRNQEIVDQYFIERDKGTSAGWAKKIVARRNKMARTYVDYCLRWYYQEAVRRKKYSFLIKFPPAKEQIVHFWRIFALDFKNNQTNETIKQRATSWCLELWKWRLPTHHFFASPLICPSKNVGTERRPQDVSEAKQSIERSGREHLIRGDKNKYPREKKQYVKDLVGSGDQWLLSRKGTIISLHA